MIRVGVLTVSDRSSKGARDDLGGPALEDLARKQGWNVEARAVVPDEKESIKEVLLDWCDAKRISLVLTTGGTGVSPRDVTPEATRGVLEKELPGIPEWMRLQGMKVNHFSSLSRAVAGTRGQTLLINLPGNPQGAVDSLKVLLDIIPHALAVLSGKDHEHKPERRSSRS